MADVAPVRTECPGESYQTKWTPLTSTNAAGGAESLPGASDKCVQVLGTFDSATVVIQGSNEVVPTTWFTLHDTNGDVLSFTAAGGDLISENTLHVRPSTSGGSVSQSLTVLILSKARMR